MPVRLVRAVVVMVTLVVALLATRDAFAYPWMIREGESACNLCHVDPSGAGLLTSFGRDEGERVLRTHYGAPDPSSHAGNFLLGAVDPPSWLLLGGSFRGAIVGQKVDSTPLTSDVLIMQGDLRAGIVTGHFRAAASAGFVTTDESLASVVGPVVSREHWVGYTVDDDAVLLRAGRINLPYGVRSIEHTLFVRRATRTDLNDTQEHGVAASYTGDLVRAELMGILGNYQISPDEFRNRGYSGYVELVPDPHLAVGASSLLTHAAKDLFYRARNTHLAEGLFVRASPVHPLVILAEADLVLDRPAGGPNANGVATMLQLDVEPLRGLHLIGTGETLSPSGSTTVGSYGGWGSVDWFFLPHTDVRFDYMRRKMAYGPTAVDVTALLAQLHVYL